MHSKVVREVEERDFRMPEFYHAKIEDYEVREDGKVVRKDRWRTACYSLVSMIGMSVREFELEDVLKEAERRLERPAPREMLMRLLGAIRLEDWSLVKKIYEDKDFPDYSDEEEF